MTASLAALLYLGAGVLFILAIRGLSSPETARMGNALGMIGMGIAILVTLLFTEVVDALSWGMILVGVLIGGGIGTAIALRVPMTDMPQIVAFFNSFVGLAAVLVSAAEFYAPTAFGIADATGGLPLAALVEIGLGVAIGAVTFTGSVVAAGKLQGFITGAPLVFPGQKLLNLALIIAMVGLIVGLAMTGSAQILWVLIALTFILGVLIVIPIGGADMPVIISILNSYSGWASVPIGFSLQNPALIITGALVGSSGAILSYIMCKAMNRSFWNVVLGGFGGEVAASDRQAHDRPVKRGSAEDAAFILRNARLVIVVPGYGMAVAQAQHILRDMADELKEMGVRMAYAVHPVAGRMPGHMNVLLAEANVPYDEVFALEDINSDFARADVAFVIGANDVTNPAAKEDPTSPLYGMPVLDVEKAKTVLFIKRSLASGYAGVDNDLFFRDNTMMLFGDAKKMVEDIVRAL